MTYSTSTTLVIVESPAKCKKIEGFLGEGYRCVASFGHLRELPSLKHIDMENDFSPTFVIADKKRKYVQSLKTAIAQSGEVVLATDDDREGEAIAWHICMIFDLNVVTTKRIIFHEITEEAVQSAMRAPTRINMDIVHAQQTRQILDLLLGFKISPTLWKHIAHQALSAGRCQTPALKLVYDNQQEINAAEGVRRYTTTGLFRVGKGVLSFDHTKEYHTEDHVLEFYKKSQPYEHMFSCTSPKKVTRAPPAPLNTSRLQQIASNELRYSPKETMRVCQSLYESGHITYMRTDSKKYAAPFLAQARKYISGCYGANFATSDKSIQHITNDNATPHEAIRPTRIHVVNLEHVTSTKEIKLYKLIRDITLQSCMAPAELYSVKGTITSPDGEYVRKCERACFLGWMAIGSVSGAENSEQEYNILSSLPASKTSFTQINSKMHLKELKQHYTEARLVQLLEDKGIGRPSTFSMIVEKIQERNYVKKENVAGKEIVCKDYHMTCDGPIEVLETKRVYGNEKNKLVIQPTGVLVLEFLEKHFSSLFQYDYTKLMEDNLDKIAANPRDIIWTSVVGDYYREITDLLESLNNENPAKVEYAIDDTHKYIISKNGPVIKCTTADNVSFKPVKKEIDVHKLERGEYALKELIDETKRDEFNLGEYGGHDILLKKGKFGIYAVWGNENVSLKRLGNRPMENITHEEVAAIIDETLNGTREINGNLSIRMSKRGPYIFFKTAGMKRPQFFSLKECKLDFMNCDVEELKQWIYDTHQVS